jgi:hypothetical protein
MSVGNDDLFDLQVMLADEGENVLDIIAGVDDHGFAGGFVADHGTIALQRADGKDFVDHSFIV